MGHHRDPQGEPVYNRPKKVIEAFDASLKRLGRDHLDVYFDHIWWDKEEETEAFLATFPQLKSEGRVRAVGVSTNSFDYIKHFNHDGGLDVVQLDYSILNCNAEKEVLPYYQEHGIGVVVRGPLRMGLLTGKLTSKTSFTEGDIREGWPQEAWFRKSLEKVEGLRELEADGQTLRQLALRFILNHPAVSVAFPGATTPERVEANVAASVRPLLLAEARRHIDDVVPVAGG